MVEVRSVEQVRSRIQITLDNGKKYTLSRKLAQERELKPGDEIDEEAFSQWVVLHQYRQALDRAVAMLAARACSRGEIEQKLKRAGAAEETVEMVIYKLEKHGLLDDQAFAEQWAKSRAGRNIGPRRIAAELRQKGVSAEETEEAISGIPAEDAYAQALKLAKKGLQRKKAGEDIRKTLQRVISGIVRRGYDWETAREACEQAAREMAEEI